MSSDSRRRGFSEGCHLRKRLNPQDSESHSPFSLCNQWRVAFLLLNLSDSGLWCICHFLLPAWKITFLVLVFVATAVEEVSPSLLVVTDNPPPSALDGQFLLSFRVLPCFCFLSLAYRVACSPSCLMYICVQNLLVRIRFSHSLCFKMFMYASQDQRLTHCAELDVSWVLMPPNSCCPDICSWQFHFSYSFMDLEGCPYGCLDRQYRSLFVMNMMRQDTSQWVNWLELNSCSPSVTRNWISVRDIPENLNEWVSLRLDFSCRAEMNAWCISVATQDAQDAVVTAILRTESHVWKSKGNQRKQEEESWAKISESELEVEGGKRMCYNCPFPESDSTLLLVSLIIFSVVSKSLKYSRSVNVSSLALDAFRELKLVLFHASGLFCPHLVPWLEREICLFFSTHELSHDDGQGCWERSIRSQKWGHVFFCEEMTNERHARQEQRIKKLRRKERHSSHYRVYNFFFGSFVCCIKRLFVRVHAVLLNDRMKENGNLFNVSFHYLSLDCNLRHLIPLIVLFCLIGWGLSMGRFAQRGWIQ